MQCHCTRSFDVRIFVMKNIALYIRVKMTSLPPFIFTYLININYVTNQWSEYLHLLKLSYLFVYIIRFPLLRMRFLPEASILQGASQSLHRVSLLICVEILDMLLLFFCRHDFLSQFSVFSWHMYTVSAIESVHGHPF